MVTAHFMTVDLLRQLRLGDNFAWETFYDQISPELRAYIVRLGARDPDDLLGETMIQIVRDINSFSGSPAEIRAWSFRIAHNRVIDASRRRKSRPIEVQIDTELDSLPPQVPLAEPPDTEMLSDLLQGLTPDQRSVVWLRYVSDLTLDETAVALSKAPEAVAALTYRALASLRRSLGQLPAE
ncbi:sigma-70 family RNA polymerase sigma factor [bacterium]|nr:sigma-70 family RNA polymerase sigma factor [bacterium]